jgi:hypothetical protein
MTILPKAIYLFDEIAIKILSIFITEIEKINHKVYLDAQKTMGS